MTMAMAEGAVERALQTQGESGDPIYRAGAAMLRARGARGSLLDVGCGIGRFREFAADLATDYVGVDVVRHPALAAEATFHRADLDREGVPVATASADIVAAIETIEHLEGPYGFVRELFRIVKPGGWVLITTPNQMSVLSLLSLATKGRFVAFQDSYYPIHRTALLPIDLVRIASDAGFIRADIGFTCSGRVPLTGLHYPEMISRLLPQALSDNVLLVAQRPGPDR
jgi:2-polyprenyl-3-methyl-5-hydroxy-6-metoxy-1,4-benzoquinol methylase